MACIGRARAVGHRTKVAVVVDQHRLATGLSGFCRVGGVLGQPGRFLTRYPAVFAWPILSMTITHNRSGSSPRIQNAAETNPPILRSWGLSALDQ